MTACFPRLLSLPPMTGLYHISPGLPWPMPQTMPQSIPIEPLPLPLPLPVPLPSLPAPSIKTRVPMLHPSELDKLVQPLLAHCVTLVPHFTVHNVQPWVTAQLRQMPDRAGISDRTAAAIARRLLKRAVDTGRLAPVRHSPGHYTRIDPGTVSIDRARLLKLIQPLLAYSARLGRHFRQHQVQAWVAAQIRQMPGWEKTSDKRIQDLTLRLLKLAVKDRNLIATTEDTDIRYSPSGMTGPGPMARMAHEVLLPAMREHFAGHQGHIRPAMVIDWLMRREPALEYVRAQQRVGPLLKDAVKNGHLVRVSWGRTLYTLPPGTVPTTSVASATSTSTSEERPVPADPAPTQTPTTQGIPPGGRQPSQKPGIKRKAMATPFERAQPVWHAPTPRSLTQGSLVVSEILRLPAGTQVVINGQHTVTILGASQLPGTHERSTPALKVFSPTENEAVGHLSRDAGLGGAVRRPGGFHYLLDCHVIRVTLPG